MARFILFILLVAFTFSTDQASAQQACPKRVAVMQGVALSEAAAEIMERVYRDLGCDAEFVSMPGKRAAIAFNTGIVDGEVTRLRLIETSYTRDFVRSRPPLFMLSNSLWVRPDAVMSTDEPVGHLMGVLWVERFMNGQPSVSFRSIREMFAAYGTGELQGFIASDYAVTKAKVGAMLQPPPKRLKPLTHTPVFHYMAEEYRAFMDKLSAHVMAEDPFRGFLISATH